MKIVKALKAENIGAGWLYFYIHFVTEVICFFCISKQTGDSIFIWSFPLLYDLLAFVPQSLIGYVSDRFPKISFGIAGIVMMAISGMMFWLLPSVSPYFALAFLCIGNACVHISGAEVTLRCSGGKLSHSAIFVSGGSFGLITGRILAGEGIPFWAVILLVLTSVPFVLLAETYRRKDGHEKYPDCGGFDFTNPKLSPGIIVLLAVTIVAVRGYMGYGIPTTWKKTVFQSACLYFAMGFGKAFGGLFADAYGVKKTALVSAVAALPFLFLGDNIMSLSLIGVLLFSMTMPITLAMLVSVLKQSPGLAFGWTTIGLFLGTLPIFFFKFTTTFSNCVVIALLTAVSVIAVCIVLRKDGVTVEQHQNSGK